jgi:hypothetical protein
MTGLFHLELRDMMRAMCDTLNMNTERLKRVLGLVELMDTMETRLPQPTISSAGDSIHAFPFYDGIGAEKYIEWETKIDCIFAKYFMCERKKIKKATSVLTNSALTWWESLTPSDRPQTWADMKMLMRERFVSSNDIISSNKLELPLLHDDCASNFYDKKELCDDSAITYMPQLEHKLDILSSNPVNCAEIRTFNRITSVHGELKLLYYLNTLSYIEFDVLCNLNNLEEKFSFSADLPWFSKHTYHVIGRYSWKEEYMVHRIYICSNMKSPFVTKQHDQLEGCVKANHITSSSTFPSFYVLQQ